MNSKLVDVETKAQLIEHVTQRARSDTDIEAVVNRGIAAALLIDLETGVEIMCDGGVPPHVVKRVLSDMKHRRATD
jgi:hypothetical protein